MQLTDAYDPQNIFAKILRDEMPSIRVFEDETTVAFMDIMPQAPGHVLVIPRVAATNVLTLSADDARGDDDDASSGAGRSKSHGSAGPDARAIKRVGGRSNRAAFSHAHYSAS